MKLYLQLFIFFAVLLANLIFTHKANADITTGLVNHWEFGEGSGTAINDSAGTSNGTIYNMEAGDWLLKEDSDYVLSFDGVNEYGVASSVDLSSYNAITVSFWHQTEAWADNDDLTLEFSTNYNNSSTGFMVDFNCGAPLNGYLCLSLKGNVGTHIETYSRPSAGEWHFYTIYYNKASETDEISLFIDGVESPMALKYTSSNNTNNFGDNPLYFMSRAGSNLFDDGYLDDVRIYNRLLSSSDIEELYLTTTPAAFAPPVLSNGSPAGTTLSAGTISTLISVDTNVNATCKYSTTANTDYDLMTEEFRETGEMSHETRVSELENGENYTYYVLCKNDTLNLKNTSDYEINFSVDSVISPPILLITESSNNFTKFYKEILYNEGFNEFNSADISAVSVATLDNYDVVIVGEMSLSVAQISMFTDWVQSDGGNLIVMRPDTDLASLAGLTYQSTSVSEGYLLIDTATSAGSGLVSAIIQYHGVADAYSLNGASAIATLYSNATTATSYPAVSLNSSGAGKVAVFAYDLAKSIIYTRQGNPAWAGTERDGNSPIRPNDLFYPDYVNLDKVAIPQADEQQRLLANLILTMNARKKPLPRFWYLPNKLKAAILHAVDDHGTASGTKDIFDSLISASDPGCSLDDWECYRATSWFYTGPQFTDAQAASYLSQNFEMGVHADNSCQNFTSASNLNSFYVNRLQNFQSTYPSLPAQTTHRFHCIVWSDWLTQAEVGLWHNIRLSMDYYYWPLSWINNRWGMFTGSGLPMRLADTDGVIIDVYQAPTQLVNELGSYAANISALLNKATGAEGYYGIFGTHDDYRDTTFNAAIISAAQSYNVPIVTAKQVLTWLDGRNNSTIDSVLWDNANILQFTVDAATGSTGLMAMVPTSASETQTAGSLQSISKSGNPVSYTTETIKGIEYAFFNATDGIYSAVYADTSNPTLSNVSPADNATAIEVDTNIILTFNEVVNAQTGNITLYKSGGTQVEQFNVASDITGSGTTTITVNPIANLEGETDYYVLIDATAFDDASGNSYAGISSATSWNFTTAVQDDMDDLEISRVIYSSNQNSITLKWKTNNKADEHIRYGVNRQMTSEKNNSEKTKDHKIKIDGLEADITYYVLIKSTDASDSSDRSKVYKIKTEKKSLLNSILSVVEIAEQVSDNQAQEQKQEEAQQDQKQNQEQENNIFEKIEVEDKEEEYFKSEVFKENEKQYLREMIFQIKDNQGRPIPNLPIILHSEPKEAITDENGYVVFSNVETGNHTLIFVYNDENYEHSVDIKLPKTDNGQVAMQVGVVEIKEKRSKNVLSLIIIAILVIVVMMLYFKNKKALKAYKEK